VQFANLALRQGDQSHAGKGKLFEQARYILLIAGEPIESLGDEDLETLRAFLLSLAIGACLPKCRGY